jgi:hypothetical protein
VSERPYRWRGLGTRLRAPLFRTASSIGNAVAKSAVPDKQQKESHRAPENQPHHNAVGGRARCDSDRRRAECMGSA